MFVAEEYCRNNHKLADVEALSRAEVEKALGTLKQEQFELRSLKRLRMAAGALRLD